MSLQDFCKLHDMNRDFSNHDFSGGSQKGYAAYLSFIFTPIKQRRAYKSGSGQGRSRPPLGTTGLSVPKQGVFHLVSFR